MIYLIECYYSKSRKIEYSKIMNKLNEIQLQLQPEAVTEVPLHIYEQNFTFIVNKKEFITSYIISDLLSPIISRHRLNDPSFNTFEITTNHKGNFSLILNLVNFKKQQISKDDFEFISEVLEKLGNNSINIILPDYDGKLTLDNEFGNLF